MGWMGTVKQAVSARDRNAEERPRLEIPKSRTCLRPSLAEVDERRLRGESSGTLHRGAGSERKKPRRGWLPGLFKMKAVLRPHQILL